MTTIYETELKQDKDGSWSRWLGEDSKGTKQKFRLGRDKQEAKRRLRLIVALFDSQRSAAEFYGGSWTPEMLEAAKQIAKGKQTTLPRLSLRVSDTDTVKESAESYAKTLVLLGNEFSPDPSILDEALGEIEKNQKRNRVLRSNLTGSDPDKDLTGQTIDKALEAFEQAIEKANTLPNEGLSPWGKTQLDQIKSWRRFTDSSLLQTDLADLTVAKAQELVDCIRKRPLTIVSERTKRMTPKTAGSIHKKIRHFFDWLDLSDDWEWEEPKRFRKLSYKISPLTEEEKHQKKIEKENWRVSDEEIKTLYTYATPAERVLILLGLNCAFGAGEIGSLRISYVKFESQLIDGIRFKTGSDSRHHLWSETVDGLKWELSRRGTPNSDKAKDIFFLSDKGERLWSVSAKGNYKNGIAKRWNDLLQRVKKDFPDFHQYSFGKLRKTAAIRVIEMADAEAASMILAHGIPSEDKLLSAYVNIPWAKLYETQKAYGETIKPLLKTEGNPFEQPPKDYIGRGKVAKMLEQFKEGIPVAQIAKGAKVSIMTVYRHVDRAGLRISNP